jgi:hypothetical protein
MEPIVGSGKYTYRVNEEWQRPPAGLDVRACAVSVDSQDRVYCFNRNAEHPVVIFDRDGNFLSSWGARLFTFPHAIRIVQENGQDVVWLCDEHHQTFQKFTTDGKLLQTIGEKGARSDTGVPADDFSSAAWKEGDAWRRPVQSADRHRLRPRRLDVHDRRLRQCPGAQILVRRQVPVLLGRAGHGTGPVQSAARRMDRPARSGPRG